MSSVPIYKLGARDIDANGRLLTSLGNTASAMGKSLDDIVEAVTAAITGEDERLHEAPPTTPRNRRPKP